MGNAPDMPELQGDTATSIMHGIRDPAPSSDLLIRPDPRRPLITDGQWADAGRFAYDQSRRGALHIIFEHQVGRNSIFGRTRPGQGRHQHTVGKIQITDPDGVIQGRHGVSQSLKIVWHRGALPRALRDFCRLSRSLPPKPTGLSTGRVGARRRLRLLRHSSTPRRCRFRWSAQRYAPLAQQSQGRGLPRHIAGRPYRH